MRLGPPNVDSTYDARSLLTYYFLLLTSYFLLLTSHSTYDARSLGLVAERFAELGVSGVSGAGQPRSKGKASAAKGKGRGASINLSREVEGEVKVVSVVTYNKAWASRAGARQQTSENLETHEVTGLHWEGDKGAEVDEMSFYDSDGHRHVFKTK